MSSILITHNPIVTCLLDEQGNLQQLFMELDDTFIDAVKKQNENNQLITDAKKIKTLLGNHDLPVIVDMENSVLDDWRRNRFTKILNQTGVINDYDSYRTKQREQAMKESFDAIKAYAEQKDELISQTVNAIDDLQKTINLAANRLIELYALHFPEIVETINNPVTLAKIITETPKRDQITREQLTTLSIPEKKIDFIIDHVDHSLGGDLEKDDLLPMQEYAKSLLQADNRQRELEKWIDRQMEEFAPNLAAVAGANVGARLIEAMGSLMELAKTHSSKVQIIGAEKALYSALKGRGSPPKHGIIFQIPEIGNAPYWIRGKMARKFASKIVIAARLDQFNGEFLGDEMREELREFGEKLREKHSEPSNNGGN